MIRPLALAFLLCALSAHSTEPNLPPEIVSVQKYIIEKDYPEVIGGQHYKTRIESALIADLANDGHKQVIIQYFCHYRQSALIVIYQVDGETGQVARVMEGLAPGPVQPISGDSTKHCRFEKRPLDFRASSQARRCHGRHLLATCRFLSWNKEKLRPARA